MREHTADDILPPTNAGLYFDRKLKFAICNLLAARTKVLFRFMFKIVKQICNKIASIDARQVIFITWTMPGIMHF